MAIKLKTGEEIEKMRQAGRIVRLVLDRLEQMVVPGITTEELDAEAEMLCHAGGGECLFKGVPGRGKAPPFPGVICASINEEIVHGIPSGRRLRDGDIVSVDFGVKLNGWCGDAAATFLVGDVAPDVRALVDATRNSLLLAVGEMKPGVKWSVIAGQMQRYIEGEGFSVVRDYVGHGIGRQMHEEPQIPNFVSRELLSRDMTLCEGMTLAVEPMVNMGSPAAIVMDDGWTVVTKDRMPSAHFEHTVAVTARGVEVLTDGR